MYKEKVKNKKQLKKKEVSMACQNNSDNNEILINCKTLIYTRDQHTVREKSSIYTRTIQEKKTEKNRKKNDAAS